MDVSIAAILAQDGVTTGAIYALLALALVMVFSVTRVIFLPQGEFVAYGALTQAALQGGHLASTCWLLIVLGAVCFVLDVAASTREALRRGVRLQGRRSRWIGAAALYVVYPAALTAAVYALTLHGAPPELMQIGLTFAILVPLGIFIYRIAYQPVARAKTLLLLIVSVAVHFAMVGAGLLMFGAEGVRTAPLIDGSVSIGGVSIASQSLCVLVTVFAMIAAMAVYFGHTMSGKALRATCVNLLGAQLVGIGIRDAGRLAFALAAAIGALSGMLIAPLTTLYYDSGFLIGLKGFVGAIIGGLLSYPVAALGSLAVGLLESYSSFWASEYKEIIVFSLILPVLLWRSFAMPHRDEEGA